MKPTKINVTIEGVAPLLMHRFPDEDEPEGKVKKKKKVYKATEDAEKALYKDETGTIYQPASHILGCLTKAAVAYKFEGRKTYKSAVQGGIIVEPENMPHRVTEWVIDRRPVVIQRSRIMRARPRFDKWLLDFVITVIDERIDIPTLEDMMTHAGLYYGIGDHRPRFGRFKVTRFEEQK